MHILFPSFKLILKDYDNTYSMTIMEYFTSLVDVFPCIPCVILPLLVYDIVAISYWYNMSHQLLAH